MKTTPHPTAETAPAIVTCPGCGRAHAPHPETGTWCTRACIEAQLSKPIDTRTGTVEDGMSEPAPRKRRGARH